MRFPVDADLVVFFYTVGKVLSSLPRLRQNARPVPAHYDVEEVPNAFLTEAQARYFTPYDQKLAVMNYQPVCTFRVANYGNNLMRQYVNPADTARCVVMINETAVNVGGQQTFSNSCTMSFHTRFTDGTILTTRNMKLKSILDRPPYQVIQECPGIEEPAEMKRRHDVRSQSMGCPVTPVSDVPAIFRDVQSEHERHRRTKAQYTHGYLLRTLWPARTARATGGGRTAA